MKNKILKIIKDLSKEKNLSLDLSEKNLARPYSELGIDSLTLMNLVVEIESQLDIMLDTDLDLPAIKTINDLIEKFELRK